MMKSLNNPLAFDLSLTVFGLLIANNQFPGDNSELAPPDSIPNSEVKRLSADGSVGLPM